VLPARSGGGALPRARGGSQDAGAAQAADTRRDARGFLLGQPRSSARLQLALESATLCTLAPAGAPAAPEMRCLARCVMLGRCRQTACGEKWEVAVWHGRTARMPMA